MAAEAASERRMLIRGIVGWTVIVLAVGGGLWFRSAVAVPIERCLADRCSRVRLVRLANTFAAVDDLQIRFHGWGASDFADADEDIERVRRFRSRRPVS